MTNPEEKSKAPLEKGENPLYDLIDRLKDMPHGRLHVEKYDSTLHIELTDKKIIKI